MSRKSWNRWGWHWKRGGLLYAEVNLDLINRPIFRYEWDTEGSGGFVALDWGNGNSDPVWAICLNRFFRPPAWLVRRWDREWALASAVPSPEPSGEQ